MQIELDDYSDNDFLPLEYGQDNDDILTGLVKGLGGITLALLGGSIIAMILLTRAKNRREK